MRFCDGTDMTITPTSDAEGNPELEICCSMEAVDQEAAEEPTYYYEVRLEPKPVLRSYIAAAYELCNELTDSELVQMGHDRNTGRIRLLQALETVDALADYSEEAATEEFGNYMDPPLMEKPMNQKPSLHQMEHYQKFYENGEYVRAVESTTEQNYNMIDGCANNLPKPRIINGRESVLDKLRIRRMAREKQKSSQEQSADMERNRK